jgi:hypothetical protein
LKKKVEYISTTMDPYTLEMNEKKSSANLAALILFTSFMTVMVYLFTKTTMTFVEFHNATVVKDIEGELEDDEEEEDAEEEEADEEEEAEEEEEEDEEAEGEDAKEFTVEDIDDDMPGLDDMPSLIEQYEPFTITREREVDLSGNLRPWTPLPMDDLVLNEVEKVNRQVNTLNSDFTTYVDTNHLISSRVTTQIEELRQQLKTFATHEAVDLLCEQIHQLSQKNKFDDVSAVIAEMRTQMNTFSTKDSLVNLTQEVSNLKIQVSQMITDMTSLMDKMNLVDALTIEKDVRQAWFGKASGTADANGAGLMVNIVLTARITYDKAHSVGDNKSWLTAAKKDDRESHRDGLVGYTDDTTWNIDPVKKTAVKRYHKNEWSGDCVDVHVEIDLSNVTAANLAYMLGNKGIPFAKILTYLYQEKKIVWERQLLSA